jgi:transcriptional regulator with XRE-family HTH domain
MRKINQSLIDFRTQLGMSKEEFAKVLTISVATLHQYEQGRRQIRSSIYHRAKEEAKKNAIDLPESLFFESEKSEVKSLFKAHSLKEIREYCGWTQHQMAEACGISYRTWGRYERGESQLLAVTEFKIKEIARKVHIDWEK